MKNSLQKEPKPKVNLKDIIDGKEMREQNIFIANNVKYWADRITKDQIATHVDCIDCGVEFEKDYTYQKRCFSCDSKKDNENYHKLELVEWDEKTPLVIYGDEQYFYDLDSIEEYCEDNEIDKSQLMLVLCKETHFGEINIAEQFQDELHEDWEPDGELLKIEKELNNYLRKASTNTWAVSNKRVLL
jgi:hypothetical protein